MKRADGAIDRSEACDTPSVPVAITGRCRVGNTHRGNHLGQRSRATAPKGRTYGSKRSDQIFRSALARGSRPHMELAANPALDHHLIRATQRLSPDGYLDAVAVTIAAEVAGNGFAAIGLGRDDRQDAVH